MYVIILLRKQNVNYVKKMFVRNVKNLWVLGQLMEIFNEEGSYADECEYQGDSEECDGDCPSCHHYDPDDDEIKSDVMG